MATTNNSTAVHAQEAATGSPQPRTVHEVMQTILRQAGADAAAPEGSQPWALAQIAETLVGAHDGLRRLSTELSALARSYDADELRRRAGWAASDADALLRRYF